jgi:hypothetical protein
MKITVLTDAKGKIVGTARPIKGSAGSPTHLRMVAGQGQEVLEIDIPDAMLKDSLANLHGRTIQSLSK